MNLRKIIKNFISLSGSVLAWRCTELKSWADQIVRYRIPLYSSQITRVFTRKHCIMHARSRHRPVKRSLAWWASWSGTVRVRWQLYLRAKAMTTEIIASCIYLLADQTYLNIDQKNKFRKISSEKRWVWRQQQPTAEHSLIETKRISDANPHRQFYARLFSTLPPDTSCHFRHRL